MRHIAYTTILLAVAPMASAQWNLFSEFSDRVGGRGMMYLGSQATEINSVNIRLNRNETFELRFDGRNTEVLRGNWHGDRGNVVHLDLRQIDRSEATGLGTIKFDERRLLTSIEIQGNTGARQISVRFTRSDVGRAPDWGAPGGSGPGNIQQGQMDQTLMGSGFMFRGNQRSRINEARIEVNRNRFTIRVAGEQRATFEGQARQQGRNYTLQVQRAFNRGANGSGTITVDSRGRATAVRMNGRMGNESFDVQIDQRGGGIPELDSYQDTLRRGGTIELDGRRQRLSQATVDLQRGGRLLISVSGEYAGQFSGRWTDDRRGGYELTLNTGPGGAIIGGRGTLTLHRNGSADRLFFEGRMRGVPIRVEVRG